MRYHNRSGGAVSGFYHGERLDWIRVDAREAWSVRYDQNWTPTPTSPVQRAERTFLFVRPHDGIPPYLVIEDDIVKDEEEHAYTWQWHIPASMVFETDDPPWRARSFVAKAPVLTSAGPGKASARFDFSLPRAMSCRLAGLVRAGGADPGKSDSFFVTVDGGRRLLWDLSSGSILGWSFVQDRGASEPARFTLSAGKHTIRLDEREPEAELARLLILPDKQSLPLDPRAEAPPGAILLEAAEATMGAEAFLLQTPKPSGQTNVTLDVFPVRPSGGKIHLDWFQTSREGAHPRLQYTVRGRRPCFVMLLYPRRPGMPSPRVEAIEEAGGVGAEVSWPQGTDRISFTQGTGKNPGETQFRRTVKGRAWTWASLP